MVAETVGISEPDALAMPQHLFIERVSVRFGPNEVDRQFDGATSRKPGFGLLGGIGCFIFEAGGSAMDQAQAHARYDAASGGHSRCSRSAGGRQVVGTLNVKGPEGDFARRDEAAGYAPVMFHIGGIEGGAAWHRPPVTQGGIAKRRGDSRQQHRGNRREIARDELLQQVVCEFGKLVLQLQLHARGKEGCSLEQASHHGIRAVAQDATEPSCNAWIFVGKLDRMLIEQLQLFVVEIEKFTIHSQIRSNLILPVTISRSATNLSGIFSGSQMRSASTT